METLNVLVTAVLASTSRTSSSPSKQASRFKFIWSFAEYFKARKKQLEEGHCLVTWISSSELDLAVCRANLGKRGSTCDFALQIWCRYQTRERMYDSDCKNERRRLFFVCLYYIQRTEFSASGQSNIASWLAA